MKTDQSQQNRIYLIGFMGAGKTSIGKILAKKLGYRFIDTDSIIRKKAGRMIPQIFEEEGEDKFRMMENETLYSINVYNERTVIATGGGIPADSDNLKYMLNTGIVIYLSAPVEVLYRRIKDKKGRPLSRDYTEFEDLFKSRIKYYQKAHQIIETDRLTKYQAVDKVIEKICERK